MAKWQSDTMLDQALEWLKTNMDAIYVCTSQPTTFTHASVSYIIGTAAHTIAGSVAAGDVSGRKIAVTAKSSIAVSASKAGSADHVAITGSVGSSDALLYVTTCTTKAIGQSDTINVPAWDIEIVDAA